MKQTMKYLSIAALVAVGAIMMGCNKLDIVTEQTQQEEEPVISNTVTLTTTVSLDAATKALTAAGVKTFAADDQIAVIYKNTSNETVKAVSEVIGTEAGTASATFTVTLTNPDKTKAIRYIYPAAMAKATVATDATIDDDGTVDFTNLNTQNGLLTTLGSNLDLSTFDAASWGGDVLPNGTLSNQLAILALTLKNSTGSSDITSTITGVTLSDGTNSYAVTRSAAAGPIYVAIQPTTSADITVTATDGTNNYTKSLTGKTYVASNGYSVSWRMVQIYPFTVSSGGTKVVFAPGNLQYKGSESTYKWRFAENQYDVIGAWDTSTWVDLFGWGTWTGESPKPTKTSTTYSDYTWDSADFSQEDILADATQRSYDWRTLSGGSGGEWEWILGPSSSPYPGINCRTSSTVNGTANARFAKATVVSKPGVILFPDSYTHPSDVKQPASINTANAAYTVNSYNATEWGKMETAGCVFLPAAGYRDETKTVRNSGSYGCYWSSSPYSFNANQAYDVSFYSGNLYPVNYNDSRRDGVSVRLVRQVE